MEIGLPRLNFQIILTDFFFPTQNAGYKTVYIGKILSPEQVSQKSEQTHQLYSNVFESFRLAKPEHFQTL